MAQALQPGTRIGGFELGPVIGRGGFGITYRATDSRSATPFAIKEYLPEDFARRDRSGMVTARAGHDDTYARGLTAFMSEANILKDLPRREGLVRVRGAFEKFGTAYCVMEFIAGDSLERMSRRMIARQGHVPGALVSGLAVSVCWALDGLHAKGMIHRDVKPANIMLRRNGDPVLIDFGAARRLTRRGEKETIFTRRYAALEQFPPELSGFGRSFDEGAWSDVYSLSVVLYELIARTLPPDAPARAAAVLGGGPDPYEPLAALAREDRLAAEYDPALLDAIDEGSRLMPRERTRSARDFAEAIAPGVWSGRQAAAPPSPRQTETLRIEPDGNVEPGGRRGLLMLSLLLAVLGAVLIYRAQFQPEMF